METKDITIRASGKCHPAMQFENGSIMVVCNCPGSKNGQLSNTGRKVADGHEKVNCRK